MATKKKSKKGAKAASPVAKSRPIAAQTKSTKNTKKKVPGRAPAAAKSGAKKKAASKALKPAAKIVPAGKAAKAKKAAPVASAARAKKGAPAGGAKKAKKKNATPASRPIRRRDALGHLDPAYAADLRRRSEKREDDDGAFLGGKLRSNDDLAESLGETFVTTATSGEEGGEEVLDQIVPEERGGPFVESTAGAEFAEGTDASNPKSAKREPFPTT